MKVFNNAVVSFHYSVSENGKEIENSRKGDPVLYLHGYDNMLEGIEELLEGALEGEIREGDLPASKTYGERVENKAIRVPVKHLANIPKGRKPRVGQVVEVNTADGIHEMTVTKVGLKNVDVDANHPFAGKTLHWVVEVVSVRDATVEEITHGHAHGKGGVDHS